MALFFFWSSQVAICRSIDLHPGKTTNSRKALLVRPAYAQLAHDPVQGLTSSRESASYPLCTSFSRHIPDHETHHTHTQTHEILSDSRSHSTRELLLYVFNSTPHLGHRIGTGLGRTGAALRPIAIFLQAKELYLFHIDSSDQHNGACPVLSLNLYSLPPHSHTNYFRCPLLAIKACCSYIVSLQDCVCIRIVGSALLPDREDRPTCKFHKLISNMSCPCAHGLTLS